MQGYEGYAGTPLVLPGLLLRNATDGLAQRLAASSNTWVEMKDEGEPSALPGLLLCNGIDDQPI